MIAEQCFLSGEFQEAADSIMSLAKRQALDKSVQLMLVEALYKLKGVFGLKQLFTLFRTMYRKEHDMDLDNEVLEYYFQKII